MTKYRVIEIVCVILTVFFIFSSVKKEELTSFTASEIAESVIGEMNNNTLVSRENEFIRDNLGVDIGLFSSVSYYSSDDVMDVSELFIGVLTAEEDAVYESLRGYAQDRYNLFNGYAQKEAALLDSYILETVSGVVIFCVSENEDAVFDAFNNKLKGE